MGMGGGGGGGGGEGRGVREEGNIQVTVVKRHVF